MSSDYSPTALVPHPNDIILNRMHLPPTPQLGKAVSPTIEESSEDDSDDDPIESDTNSTVMNTQRETNTDRREEWQRTMNVELERNGNELLPQTTLQPMGMTISTRRWYVAPYDEPTGEPSPSPTETMEPMTADERVASITRLLAMNQALGDHRYPGMVDIADAYTRFPNDASRNNCSNNSEHNEIDTVESMPSLEPRDDEEEENENVSTIDTNEDSFPLNLPDDDDDDPEVPMPVIEQAENEEEEGQDPYEAPPMD